MNCFRSFRLAMVVLVPAAAISLGVATALAELPAATPPAATPAPAASPSAAPAKPPAAAETPATPSPAATPVQAADPFGEETTLAPKTVIVLKGSANWDSAFETLINSSRLCRRCSTSKASKAPAIR